MFKKLVVTIIFSIGLFSIFINVNTATYYNLENLDHQLTPSLFSMEGTDTLTSLVQIRRKFESIYGHRADENNGIPRSQSRTSADYHQSLSYECHDNLPQLLGLFKQIGDEAYPVFVIESRDTLFHYFEALLTPGNRTHAAILVYIGNRPYLFDTVSVGYIDLLTGEQWGEMNPIFQRSYKYIVGLLSRHGEFYSPYYLPIDFDFFLFFKWLTHVITSRIWAKNDNAW